MSHLGIMTVPCAFAGQVIVSDDTTEMIVGYREIIKFILEISMEFRDRDGLMRREIEEGFVNMNPTDLIRTRRAMLSFKRTIGKEMLNPAIESHQMTMKDFTGFSEIVRSEKIMLNGKKFQIRRLMGHILIVAIKIH
jgi:hypothetical protein